MIMIRRIIGQSMQPHFVPGMLVFGMRFKRPKVGDVVIANHKGREIIKRIERCDKEGYFLVGDNAGQSSDSRTYGWFARTMIKSVVIGRFAR